MAIVMYSANKDMIKCVIQIMETLRYTVS